MIVGGDSSLCESLDPEIGCKFFFFKFNAVQIRKEKCLGKNLDISSIFRKFERNRLLLLKRFLVRLGIWIENF